jgi:hypothetical protein
MEKKLCKIWEKIYYLKHIWTKKYEFREKCEFKVKPIEELEVETHDNYKMEHEDQDCTHQDNQNSIDKDYKFE